MEQFLRYDQICFKKLPLVKIRKKQAKIEMSLSQLLIIRYIQNLGSRYMFLWMTNTTKLVTFLCISPKTSKFKMASNYGKKSFSVLGERQETQIMKFNSHTYTLSLQCPSYRKFAQLSHESSCSHELWCRECATWYFNMFWFFKTLFHTHNQRYTAGTKCYKTM